MVKVIRSFLLIAVAGILLSSYLPAPAQAKEYVGSVVIENGEFHAFPDPLVGPGRLSYRIHTKSYESIDILVMDKENAERYVLGEPCTIIGDASSVGTWNATKDSVTLKTGGYVIVFDNTDFSSAKPSQNVGSKNVTVFYHIEYTGLSESSGFFKDLHLTVMGNMTWIALGVVVIIILISVFTGKKRKRGGAVYSQPQAPRRKVTVTRRYYRKPPQQGQPPQQGYPPNQRRPPNQPPY